MSDLKTAFVADADTEMAEELINEFDFVEDCFGDSIPRTETVCVDITALCTFEPDDFFTDAAEQYKLNLDNGTDCWADLDDAVHADSKVLGFYIVNN